MIEQEAIRLVVPEDEREAFAAHMQANNLVRIRQMYLTWKQSKEHRRRFQFEYENKHSRDPKSDKEDLLQRHKAEVKRERAEGKR